MFRCFCSNFRELHLLIQIINNDLFRMSTLSCALLGNLPRREPVQFTAPTESVARFTNKL